jgi:hypothetical protein
VGSNHLGRRVSFNKLHGAMLLAMVTVAAAWANPLIAQQSLPAARNAVDLGKAVQFALQCNANLGTIEDVTVTQIEPERAGIVTVRGTYHQKIGGVSVFKMHSTDTVGGVFEGNYDVAATKFRAIQFKISVRAGYVAQTCLR